MRDGAFSGALGTRQRAHRREQSRHQVTSEREQSPLQTQAPGAVELGDLEQPHLRQAERSAAHDAREAHTVGRDHPVVFELKCFVRRLEQGLEAVLVGAFRHLCVAQAQSQLRKRRERPKCVVGRGKLLRFALLRTGARPRRRDSIAGSALDEARHQRLMQSVAQLVFDGRELASELAPTRDPSALVGDERPGA
ncbi:MAG: hypothetical protein QM756_39860 [Polyangiaceae bacterium]